MLRHMEEPTLVREREKYSLRMSGVTAARALSQTVQPVRSEFAAAPTLKTLESDVKVRQNHENDL